MKLTKDDIIFKHDSTVSFPKNWGTGKDYVELSRLREVVRELQAKQYSRLKTWFTDGKSKSFRKKMNFCEEIAEIPNELFGEVLE